MLSNEVKENKSTQFSTLQRTQAFLANYTKNYVDDLKISGKWKTKFKY
jgi:hypothetical protein